MELGEPGPESWGLVFPLLRSQKKLTKSYTVGFRKLFFGFLVEKSKFVILKWTVLRAPWMK